MDDKLYTALDMNYCDIDFIRLENPNALNMVMLSTIGQRNTMHTKPDLIKLMYTFP